MVNRFIVKISFGWKLSSVLVLAGLIIPMHSFAQGEALKHAFATEFFQAFRQNDEQKMTFYFADSLVVNEAIHLMRQGRKHETSDFKDDSNYHQEQSVARKMYIQNLTRNHASLEALGIDWANVRLDSAVMQLKKNTPTLKGFQAEIFFNDYVMRLNIVLFDSVRNRFFCLDPEVPVLHRKLGFNVGKLKNLTNTTAAVEFRDTETGEKLKITPNKKEAIEPNLPGAMAEEKDEATLSKKTSDMDSKTIYSVVESLPQFPGGEENMKEFIMANLVYPSVAVENEIEGKVIVQFIVNQIGEIEDVEILRPLEGGCSQAAIDVVKRMPNWIPGKQNGKAVRVRMRLPIAFRLK